MKARYISVLNSKGNIFFRRLRTATVRWLWYPFFTLSWILGFVLLSAFLRPVLGGLGQFLYMHFLDLTLGIRFEPVLGCLILIISNSNHITMTSTARVTSITNHYICVLHWEIGSCPINGKAKDANDEIQVGKQSETLLNEPLEFQFAFLLSKATEFFSDAKTKEYTSNLIGQMLQSLKKEVTLISLGLLVFHRAVVTLL